MTIAEVAFQAYESRHDALLREARIAEESRRPLKARRIRHYAAIVARAADAEDRDPPIGDHDDRMREGWRP